jgi:hypothetical protein
MVYRNFLRNPVRRDGGYASLTAGEPADSAGEGGIIRLRDASEATWWRRTWQFAGSTVIVATMVCLIPALFGDAKAPLVFGLTIEFFLAVVLVPLVLLAGAFFFVGRQQALDRRHEVAED